MCGNLEKGKNLHHLVRESSKDGSYVKAKTQYFYTFLSVFAIDTANGLGLAVLSFFLFKTLTFFPFVYGKTIFSKASRKLRMR